jgi:hypothetical protein
MDKKGSVTVQVKGVGGVSEVGSGAEEARKVVTALKPRPCCYRLERRPMES